MHTVELSWPVAEVADLVFEPAPPQRAPESPRAGPLSADIYDTPSQRHGSNSSGGVFRCYARRLCGSPGCNLKAYHMGNCQGVVVPDAQTEAREGISTRASSSSAGTGLNERRALVSHSTGSCQVIRFAPPGSGDDKSDEEGAEPPPMEKVARDQRVAATDESDEDYDALASILPPAEDLVYAAANSLLVLEKDEALTPTLSVPMPSEAELDDGRESSGESDAGGERRWW